MQERLPEVVCASSSAAQRRQPHAFRGQACIPCSRHASCSLAMFRFPFSASMAVWIRRCLLVGSMLCVMRALMAGTCHAPSNACAHGSPNSIYIIWALRSGAPLKAAPAKLLMQQQQVQLRSRHGRPNKKKPNFLWLFTNTPAGGMFIGHGALPTYADPFNAGWPASPSNPNSSQCIPCGIGVEELKD